MTIDPTELQHATNIAEQLWDAWEIIFDKIHKEDKRNNRTEPVSSNMNLLGFAVFSFKNIIYLRNAVNNNPDQVSIDDLKKDFIKCIDAVHDVYIEASND
jgi:hypothetical protein